MPVGALVVKGIFIKQRMEILETVYTHEPASVSQISREVSSTPANTSVKIQDMVDAGLLTKQKDGITKQVKITDRGKTIVEAMEDAEN